MSDITKARVYMPQNARNQHYLVNDDTHSSLFNKNLCANVDL